MQKRQIFYQKFTSSLLKYTFLMLLGGVCTSIYAANTNSRGQSNQSVVNPKDTIPSARVFLLTCSAGQEVYALFGHTAIHTMPTSEDSKVPNLVYNYGQFDMNQPNFMMRFIQGKTDYKLGYDDFVRFYRIYRYLNREVYALELNLSSAETDTLVRKIQVNALPKNAEYRYNFFFDNCATRPRDIIEQSVHGKIIYPVSDTLMTFRDAVHQYTEDSKWYQLGMDLLLGQPADRAMTQREHMFVPFYLEAMMRGAQIERPDGTRVPLVKSRTLFLAQDNERLAEEKREAHIPISPIIFSLILLLLAILITVWDNLRGRFSWVFDFFIYFTVGCVGVVIAFLNFFSVHPAVSPNLLLLIFHPLYFVLIPNLLKNRDRQKASWIPRLFAGVVFLSMILFIIFKIQMVSCPIVLLASALLIRLIAWTLIPKKPQHTRRVQTVGTIR